MLYSSWLAAFHTRIGAPQTGIVCFACCSISSTLHSVRHSISPQLNEWVCEVNGKRTGKGIKPTFWYQLFISFMWHLGNSFSSFTKKMVWIRWCLWFTHGSLPSNLFTKLSTLSNVPWKAQGLRKQGSGMEQFFSSGYSFILQLNSVHRILIKF